MSQVVGKYYPKNLFFRRCGYYRQKDRIDRLREIYQHSARKRWSKVSLEPGHARLSIVAGEWTESATLGNVNSLGVQIPFFT
tara:strand:+ start:1172 stop:1417 length:246 start_codon:yes stop_codon:yes gene_type:complete